MANRWAIATGNKSNPAIWDGGVSVPGAGDTVGANGFTVTIDTDWTVTAITTAAVGSGVAGGGFILSDGVTLTGNVGTAATTAGTTLTYSGSTSAAIIGNVQQGSASLYIVLHTGTGHLTITGSSSGNSAASGDGYIKNNSSGTLTFNGHPGAGGSNPGYGLVNGSTGIVNIVYAGTISNGSAQAGRQNIRQTGTGTINITANVLGNGVASSPTVINVSNGTINVVGTVTGGTNGEAITMSAGGSLTVTGNVTGGATSVAPAISNNSTATINVTGNVTGGTGGDGIRNISTGLVIITGDAIPGAGASGVGTVGAGQVVVIGNIQSHSAGYMGVGIGRMTVEPTTSVYHAYRKQSGSGAGVGVESKLYTTGTVQGHPLAADVRHGTAYGFSAEFTGTMRVPATQYVSPGVLVDAGVGTQGSFDIASIGGSTTAVENMKNLALASETGTAQAGGASTITLRAGAVNTADYFKDQVIVIVSGTGAGQTNRITAYSTGRVATVGTPWATVPDNTSVYVILARIG